VVAAATVADVLRAIADVDSAGTATTVPADSNDRFVEPRTTYHLDDGHYLASTALADAGAAQEHNGSRPGPPRPTAALY